VAFAGDRLGHSEKRLDFLRYNGDLVVMAAVIGIARRAPVGHHPRTLLTHRVGHRKVLPQLRGGFRACRHPDRGHVPHAGQPAPGQQSLAGHAKIFSPLVLVMLLAYLTAIIFSGKNPYNNREFLLIFNALLIGVMAIIFFSVAGTEETARGRTGTLILFLLSAVTILVNGIALSAILFRFRSGAYAQPGRRAGRKRLIWSTVLVTVRLFRARQNGHGEVGESIASFLPCTRCGRPR
jgi:hypothetical protein